MAIKYGHRRLPEFKDHSISHVLGVGVTSAEEQDQQTKTMAKKKIVVKVSMNGGNQKCSLFPNCTRQDNRRKALQIAAAVPGFESMSLKGADRDMIELTADGVDPVKLTHKLRKGVGYANLETVAEVKEEKKKEETKPKKDEPPKPTTVVWASGPPVPHMSCVVTEPGPPCCTIM